MAYTDLDSMKSFLKISTGTTGDDALITLLVTAAQKQIESVCKRSFESSTATYYYRANDIITHPIGSQYRPPGYRYGRFSWDTYPGGGSYTGASYGNTVLWLGKELLSVSTLTNGDADATVITSSGYWLEPRNEPPYQWIRLRSTHSWQFGTDGEVSVAGGWGFTTAAPADIVQATKVLTKFHYDRRKADNTDVVAMPEAGIITVPQGVPADVMKILKDGGYMKGIRIL